VTRWAGKLIEEQRDVAEIERSVEYVREPRRTFGEYYRLRLEPRQRAIEGFIDEQLRCRDPWLWLDRLRRSRR
jgi:hypothetical protein